MEKKRLKRLPIGIQTFSEIRESGYLTIKDGNPRAGIYTLDIPNNEIRIGLNGSLLPNYVRSEVGELRPVLFEMSGALNSGDIDTAPNE